MSGEYRRKALHLVSLSIPIVYYYITRSLAIGILIPLTAFSIFIDIGRHYIPAIGILVTKLFDPILREHERGGKRMLLSGATWVFISALLCVLVFPKIITVTAFAILIVSDASSALIGRAYGKHKFLDKSLEGSIAFVISAWCVVLASPKIGYLPAEYFIGVIAAVIGGIVEAASVRLRLDDNLSVPASIGIVMWAFYYCLTLIDPSRYDSIYAALLKI